MSKVNGQFMQANGPIMGVLRYNVSLILVSGAARWLAGSACTEAAAVHGQDQNDCQELIDNNDTCSKGSHTLQCMQYANEHTYVVNDVYLRKSRYIHGKREKSMKTLISGYEYGAQK